MARVLDKVGGSEQALPLAGRSPTAVRSDRRTTPGQALQGWRSYASQKKASVFGIWDVSTKRWRPTKRVFAVLRNWVTTQGVAVGKVQIGSIRIDQGRYSEALTALAEARERFTQLDEPEHPSP